jgi:acyl-CoA thioesterase
LIGTRGLSIGTIFDRSGRQIASIAQEVLIRPRRA